MRPSPPVAEPIRPPPLVAALVLLLACSLLTAPASASNCVRITNYGAWEFFTVNVPAPAEVTCLGWRCHKPELTGAPVVDVIPADCDGNVSNCQVRLTVPLRFPGNSEDGSDHYPQVYWYPQAMPIAGCTPNGGNLCGQIAMCGPFGAARIVYDEADVTVRIGGLNCDNLPTSQLKTYSLSAFGCSAAGSCQRQYDLPGLDLSLPRVKAKLKCIDPPEYSCSGDAACEMCRKPGKGGCGVSIAGGGAGCNLPQSGPPDAPMSYLGGGTGGPGFPGSSATTGDPEVLAALTPRKGGQGAPGLTTAGLSAPGQSSLVPRAGTDVGRYWMHPWAERLVPDPSAGTSLMWLLTRHGSFRRFSSPDAGGLYQTVSPTDEQRQLTDIGASWELWHPNGTVQRFDTNGLWTETEDRFGNLTTGTYTGNLLTGVSLPDGRSLSFSYAAAGIGSITETGIDGTTQRTWSYTWTGEDLTRIDRPDGRAWKFLYEDVRFPGYVTQVILVGNDTPSSERVEAAFSYDAEGNVEHTWAGAASTMDAAAVDVWSFGFDDPDFPTETAITDPLGNVATAEIGYDGGNGPGGNKPKLLRIEGDCPSCGLGPNAQLTYGDADHPLRPTREVDGNGHITDWTYTDHGEVETRTEAVGTALERHTSYGHDATYPALVETITRPSVKAGEFRETTLIRAGSTEQLTETGTEDTAAGDDTAFSYTTFTTLNAAGQPETIDPPGYGTADQISFSYDATRGDLLPLTRTDPLLGATTFEYDAWNRRTLVTDPNGVSTRTVLDLADRVEELRQEGASPPAGDLATTHEYNAFGDLWRTTLPRGNVIERGYDHAGRLEWTERKPDTSAPGERVFHMLDAAGNRTRTERQHWDTTSSTWVAESVTETMYSTRCRADRVTQAPGTPEEASTEYLYDCNGNLASLWDGNHTMGTDPATQTYSYDDLDRLVTVTEPWNGGSPGGTGAAVTTYGFDVQDHLTQVTDAEGNSTAYRYSDRDLLTRETSPVSGVTNHRYNDHGVLETTIDARGISVQRTLDELDRVTLVDYPEAPSGEDLDVTYTYDDPAIDFSLGRLTAITRAGESVDYRYDRFGRTTQDGALTYTLDANGNVSEIGYPGGMSAVYGFDFADRPTSLTVERPGLPDQPVVTATSYLPGGPLSELVLGNGVTETRSFDRRYLPGGIDATTPTATLLGWTYTLDGVGNPTAITDGLDAANNRIYSYLAPQYFLTQGDGPWGELAYSYDRIGNRLTETQDSIEDTYAYGTSPTGGNTPQLETIQLGVGGSRTYQYGPAGHQEQVNAAGNQVLFSWDAAGRLTQVGRPGAGTGFGPGSDFAYDARSFLRSALETNTVSPLDLFADDFESGDTCAWPISVGEAPRNCPPPAAPETVAPLYDSAGLLHVLDRGSATETIVYLGNRAVAQLKEDNGSDTWTYLTTDHLGTPVLATDDAGAVLWQGGFEPFGRDYSGAEAAGVSLRFPGQWENAAWSEATSGSGMFYNVYRWYEPGTGRYTRTDPLGLNGSGPNLYLYGGANPLNNVDPDGRFIPRACKPDDIKWCQSQCQKRNLRFAECNCFGIPLCLGLLDYAVAACKEWQNGCPPCPPPPPPVIDYEHGHGPCKPGEGHFHYFEYHQSPPPQCVCRLVRRFGGCL